MQIIFYIGKHEIQDHLIRFLTKSKISHCELVFSDKVSFSAIPTIGTRFTNLKNISDTNTWITVDLPWIYYDAEVRIRRFCEQENNCKYDWSAVLLGRINPLHNHRSKWFCSEICAAAIRPFTRGLTDFWYTPSSLYLALKDTKVFNV